MAIVKATGTYLVNGHLCIGPVRDGDVVDPATLPEFSGIITTPVAGTTPGAIDIVFSVALPTLYCVTLGVKDGTNAAAFWSNMTVKGFTITTRDMKSPNKPLGGVTVCWRASRLHA